MANKTKKLLVLLGVIVVIAIIIIAAASQNKKQAANTGAANTNTGTAAATPAAVATPSATSDYNKDLTPAPAAAEITALKDAKVVVPGANAITKDNKVVTATGKIADNSARVASPEAPRATPLLKKEDLPASLTKINISAAGYSPAEFTTKAGAPTSFSLTSTDDGVHTLTFNDPSLSAVTMLVGPGQTKAITFQAPAKVGEYTFHCDAPYHTAEVGKMIVQ